MYGRHKAAPHTYGAIRFLFNGKNQGKLKCRTRLTLPENYLPHALWPSFQPIV